MNSHTFNVRPGTGNRSNREVEITFTNMQLIGYGSFGTVHSAKLQDDGTQIAIKKIPVNNNFKDRELTLMLELDHPNIIRLLYYYYSTTRERFLNLIMEFMPDNLHNIHQHYAHNNKQMPSSSIKLYSYQLLRAVGFLHLNSIVHRDIKPTNLLVDEKSGILKLCDFGSAKRLVKNEQNISYICSRYYRAPELIFGSKNYDYSIDVWSCGAVIGELLHNSPIFAADSSIDVLVLQFKALGTPSKEEMSDFNYPYFNIPIKPVTGEGIQKFISRKLSMSTLQLINSMLKINPKERINPYEALALPFFDALRESDFKTNKCSTVPPLFDWLEREFTANSEIIRKIVPGSLFQN